MKVAFRYHSKERHPVHISSMGWLAFRSGHFAPEPA